MWYEKRGTYVVSLIIIKYISHIARLKKLENSMRFNILKYYSLLMSPEVTIGNNTNVFYFHPLTVKNVMTVVTL